MMALVEARDEQTVVRAMGRDYFDPNGIRPNHLLAAPSAGAALL
jgi:hypothetical protein